MRTPGGWRYVFGPSSLRCRKGRIGRVEGVRSLLFGSAFFQETLHCFTHGANL